MRRGWRRWVGVVGVVGLGVWVTGSSGLAVAQGTPVGGSAGAADCVAGATGIGDGYFPTTGNGGYDVQHYDIDLAVDVETSEITAATATIEAFAVADLCSFNLDFEGLAIHGITVDGVGAARQRHGKELTVTPEEPIGAGDDFTVVVRYAGTPLIQSGLGDGPPSSEVTTPDELSVGGGDPNEDAGLPGGWFTAEDEVFILGEPTGNRTWFPLDEHPADKATYTLRITVAEPFVVVADGVKTDEIDNGDTTTFVYESADPIANYLVTFHAGRLDVEELEGPHGLPITLSFAPSVPESQRAVYRRLPEMIAWEEGLFGPYPFETAGATVAGAEFSLALETQTMPTFGRYGSDPDAALSPEATDAIAITLVHELSHQWFGDAVSVQRWRDIWLNEGFATYAEALWLEETGGVGARDEMLRRLYAASRDITRLNDPAQLADLTAADVLAAIQAQGQLADQESIDSFLGLVDAKDEAALGDIPAQAALDALAKSGVPPSLFPGVPVLTGDPGRAELFSSSGVYGRGALTLHALRQEVGDEAFFATLQAWVARYGGGNAGTADFVALAEEISGEELSPLFDAWLFQAPLPKLTGIG